MCHIRIDKCHLGKTQLNINLNASTIQIKISINYLSLKKIHIISLLYENILYVCKTFI